MNFWLPFSYGLNIGCLLCVVAQFAGHRYRVMKRLERRRNHWAIIKKEA